MWDEILTRWRAGGWDRLGRDRLGRGQQVHLADYLHVRAVVLREARREGLARQDEHRVGLPGHSSLNPVHTYE